jgi:hypothetical protein
MYKKKDGLQKVVGNMTADMGLATTRSGIELEAI